MKARIFIFTIMMAMLMGSCVVSADEVIDRVILGDVNSDNVVNVRDCAMIARKLAQDKAYELTPETADYNKDTHINVRDAAAIASDLHLNLNEGSIVRPDKSKYDLENIAGIKDYINDMLCYKAFEDYGITDIKADDTVQSDTWYAPTTYIPNEDYYSAVTSVEENGIEGCFPSCYTTGVEDTIADLEKALEQISYRENSDGTLIDMSQQRLRIKWVPIDDGGNYEIYLCYGGEY